MELPGIEPAVEIALTCGDAYLRYAKVRETTRNANGVDGVNSSADRHELPLLALCGSLHHPLRSV